MAEDMIARAAKPILEFAYAYRLETTGDTSIDVARAALGVALDPNDEALVTYVAKAIHCDGFTNEWEDVLEISKQEFLDHARVAIRALKQRAQGVPSSQEQVREKD